MTEQERAIGGELRLNFQFEVYDEEEDEYNSVAQPYQGTPITRVDQNKYQADKVFEEFEDKLANVEVQKTRQASKDDDEVKSVLKLVSVKPVMSNTYITKVNQKRSDEMFEKELESLFVGLYNFVSADDDVDDIDELKEQENIGSDEVIEE